MRHLKLGVLLLDLSVPCKPWLCQRNPSEASECALVLQVTAEHWEPIAHQGSCVLRDWEQAVRLARVISHAPQLEAESIPTYGGSKYEGTRIGWGGEERDMRVDQLQRSASRLAPPATSYNERLEASLAASGLAPVPASEQSAGGEQSSSQRGEGGPPARKRPQLAW